MTRDEAFDVLDAERSDVGDMDARIAFANISTTDLIKMADAARFDRKVADVIELAQALESEMTREQAIKEVRATELSNAKFDMDHSTPEAAWRTMARYGAAIKRAREAGIDVPRKYKRGKGGR